MMTATMNATTFAPFSSLLKTRKPSFSQFDHEPFRSLMCRFPSLRSFYESDEKVCMDTVNSLIIMEHLVNGTRKDHQALISQQKSDILALGSFCQLYGFFYKPFRLEQEMRRRLELFIYLDGFCRTEAARKLVNNLPVNPQESKSRDYLALALIKHQRLPEIQQLDWTSEAYLRRAFSYRLFITGQAPGHTVEFTNEVKRIALAGVICDIAGLSSDQDNLGASRMLTESMARELLDNINHINDVDGWKAESTLCSLTLD